MTLFKDQTLLVTGAGGNLGRLAVEELLARGATKIVAGTRDTAKLADLAAKGVDVRHLDFDDADSIAKALAGVERMLLVSTIAPNRLEQQTKAVAAAKAAGVKYIAYTSAPNARPNADAGGITDHYWTEQAVAASGLDFTLLRNHIYADMTIVGAGPALASGQLFDATNGGGRNYVTRLDTARTAAGALLSATGKEIVDVTGPAPVTQEEVAALYTRLTGKSVTRVGLTGEQLQGGLEAAGVHPFMAALLVAFDLDAAAGFHAVVTDVVERFSGRKPETLESFLTANKAALTA
ncbi:MAG: NAD(P)H-binding protein [Candidatus Devosia phytovorans]|uniref:NAD(P)H-binding protein n=1 Tax=Candidatus Devosia phytovorans TaxID=3121372 RepID=A0AAJ6B124_9HYPH|nr:NAD(P)H-binding protein [Devosia sp.]WEK06305.1 MAG: NAD(P)H-binding protein [Devosia sp.]